ncbi:TRAP transporter substrate-binding protein [Limnobacter humi]|uniref:TRAP transporter substrate-binding protein n=1 Tax=Limnobacter humi TaxID=1778671 RepID=A0ABT1WH85_9BURK|nr:TRAP transporter substrate-binding protein [Limnobacter humi]MCQ8896883.1 TRAP transporter substrate-binding protein [Limnobacter humi]
MKQPVLMAAAILTSMLLTATAQAKPSIVIRFSHVVEEDTPKGQAALEFKRLVESRSRGRVQVQVYPNSSLYKDKEELEALQLGAVEMLAPSLAKFGQLGLRDFEVFDLPYIFPNRDTLNTVTRGPIGRKLFEQLEARGIKGLAYWDNGFKVMSSNTPLRFPEDLKGKRMRIQPSRVIEAQMEALGATPIPLAFSDAYAALETGLVDGTENPPSNLFSKNMHLVQKYVAVTNHGYLGYAVIVNKKFWDGLPGDVRKLLDDSLEEATRKNNQEADKLNRAALDAVKKSKKTQVNELTDAERAVWRKALEPVYRKMEGRIDRDLINAIRRVAENSTQPAY